MRLVVEGDSVRYVTAEEDEANDPEIQELEGQLVRLREREAERKERESVMDLDRWRWQELFDRQLVVDLKEERHWARRKAAERDRDEMRYLTAQLEQAAADDRVQRLIAQKWDDANQREREQSIATRRAGLESLTGRAHDLAKSRRDKWLHKRMAFDAKQRTVELRRQDAATQWQATALDVILKTERKERSAIQAMEINHISKVRLEMKKSELAVERQNVTAKAKREEAERIGVITSAEQSRLSWDMKMFRLRKSWQRDDIVRAREFHQQMLSECDRQLAEIVESMEAPAVKLK